MYSCYEGRCSSKHLARCGAALVAAVLASLVAGCGSGHNASTNSADNTGRKSALARFQVDVRTGKVTVTNGVDTAGRAVLTGGAVSFTSSDLLSVGGDAGQRKIRITATNNTNQGLPNPVRLIINNLANNAVVDIPGNTGVSTTAGSSGSSGTTDAYGTAALFATPAAITTGIGATASSLYVSDSANHNIRIIGPDSYVRTFAGSTAGAGGSGTTDGAGTAARFNGPQQIAVDGAGNLFVADTGNNTIRRITPAGQVDTIAGTGDEGSDNGVASAAKFKGPRGIAVSSDGDRIYVADTGNNVIRLVQYVPSTGATPNPRNVKTSYSVSTVAGPASGASGPDDGNASTARFNTPVRLAILADSTGNEALYVADKGNHALRRISNPEASTTSVTKTIAGASTTQGSVDGNGATATLSSPNGIAAQALDSGGHVLYFTEDSTSSRVRAAIYTPGSDTPQKSDYYVRTLAGNGDGTTDPGTGATARFTAPAGLCVVPVAGPSATLYVADAGSHRVRRVNVPSGALQSGTPSTTSVTEAVRLLNADGEVPNTPSTGGVTAAWVKMLGSDLTAELQFHVPNGVASFTFTVYLETDTDLINLPAVGAVYLSTLAGDSIAGSANGPGKLAEFNGIWGVAAVPTGLQNAYNVSIRAFIADRANNSVRYLDTSGNIGTFVGSLADTSILNGPQNVAVGPDGSVYVTDYFNHRVCRANTAGAITVIAGSSAATGNTDGTGDVARFYNPNGITVDAGGTLFVTDSYVHLVRKIEFLGGNPAVNTAYKVTTIAGVSGSAGNTDGAGASALFNAPAGIVADTDGKIYVADQMNHRIRMLARTGANTVTVSTIAGNGQGNQDGIGTAALFYQPMGIAIDTAHNLYVADLFNHALRRISPATWEVKSLVNNGGGLVDGTAGKLSGPRGVAVESSGTVLVTDGNTNALRAVQRLLSTAQSPTP